VVGSLPCEPSSQPSNAREDWLVGQVGVSSPQLKDVFDRLLLALGTMDGSSLAQPGPVMTPLLELSNQAAKAVQGKHMPQHRGLSWDDFSRKNKVERSSRVAGRCPPVVSFDLERPPSNTIGCRPVDDSRPRRRCCDRRDRRGEGGQRVSQLKSRSCG
jgi:hypothetical protein